MVITYKRICLICKKEFIPTRGEYYTCSIKCGCRIRKGRTAYNSKEVKCEYCGKEFLTQFKKLKLNKHHYCSTHCYFIDKKEKTKGKMNSNYKNVDTKRTCPTCKKEFNTYQKKRKYCSSKCVKQINLKKRGTKYEWKARDELRKEGYTVIRSAGSQGASDLIAFNSEHFRLIQVKATKNMTAKIKNLFKEDIERLENTECPQNAIKELWCWRHRQNWEKLVL